MKEDSLNVSQNFIHWPTEDGLQLCVLMNVRFPHNGWVWIYDMVKMFHYAYNSVATLEKAEDGFRLPGIECQSLEWFTDEYLKVAHSLMPPAHSTLRWTISLNRKMAE